MLTGVILTEQQIKEALEKCNGSGKDILRHVEDVIISMALIQSNGNQAKAAKMIGFSRCKMQYRLKSVRIGNEYN